eukprot:CAMPEP_0198207682 /NCGR_PEP_ID=MMETSP1445-20131203/11115_1 /TAXON_ID=36898 /ORGANISM="Pyramimonas sp., Strain CCMP2087" /LENGTH=149 /DNA_ID=CAMNT_0043880805 /DNA_START=88 /DNA_END=537 /DNA_ORIENTATION=-
MEEAVPSVTKDVKASAGASVGAPNPRFSTRTPAQAGSSVSQWEGLPQGPSSSSTPSKMPAPAARNSETPEFLKPKPAAPATARAAEPKAQAPPPPPPEDSEGGLPILPVLGLVAVGIIAKLFNFESRPKVSGLQASVLRQMKKDKGMYK